MPANGERIHLFVDAPRYWPLGAVPSMRAGAPIYVVDGDLVERTVLPVSDLAVQDLRVRGRVAAGDSQLRGTFTVEIRGMQGFAFADRMREMKANVRTLAARQMGQQMFAGWTVEKAAMPVLEPGSPFRLELTMRRGGVQATGDRFLAPLPMPPERHVASYGDRAERTLPYRQGQDVQYDWVVEFDPGDDLRVVRVPDPVSLQWGPIDYELTCTRNDGGLRFARRLRLVPATFPAADFGAWLRTLSSADQAEQATIELAAR
jgi:hypothetical protein